MARSLKQIKNRIRSIESTRKVTHAMEMISVAKLNRIDKALFALRPYAQKIESVLNNLLSATLLPTHALLQEREVKKKIGLCLITSDGGLCGSYNNNIIRFTEGFIKEKGRDRIAMVAVGKKGQTYFFKRGIGILNSYLGTNGRYSEKVSEEISGNLVDIFVSGQVDEVYVAYTHYETGLIQKPVIKKFLNITAVPENNIEYILEPDKESILKELLLKFIWTQVSLFILEAFTSEHAARTLAMKTATDNAEDLLESLILLRNKVRQANITQEMLEIISSSEALRG